MPMMKHQSLSLFPVKNVCISEKETFSFEHYSFYQNSSTKTQKRRRRSSRRHDDVAMMINAQEHQRVLE
tara:strand:+ start:313 stop:519 length:207 start_codon:yes stop_codon:yes gene_type:complete